MILVLLFELAMYFFSSYAILKDIYGYIPKRKKLIYVVLLIYLILGIANTLIKVNMHTLYLLAIIVIILNIFLLKSIFYMAKIRTIICIFIVLYSINISLSSITIFVLEKSNSLIVKQLIGTIVNTLFVIICVFICKLRRSYLQPRIKLIPLSVKRITILSLIAGSIILDLISDYSTIRDITQWGISIRITLVVLIIIVGSAFPIMIVNSIGKSFYSEQSKNFENQIKTQTKYYEALSKSSYELRKFRHDYKNMRIGVTKYIQDGNIKEAENMLNLCDSSLNQTTQSLIKFDTGNDIVDAILTEKQEKATTVNTMITFSGAVPANSINATDLCVIFGNALDNAIEACEKLKDDKEKIISVVCKSSKGFMFLTITNPVNENVNIHNNSILTTKQNKSNHGFGIYSIQKIVDNYGGSLTLSCKDCSFKCEIILNI